MGALVVPACEYIPAEAARFIAANPELPVIFVNLFPEGIAEIPMTALGVTMKIFSILMAILIGLGSGAQPIFGYNYGAGKYDRVKDTFKYTMGLSVASMCVAWIIFQVAPEPIVSIFGNDSEMYTQFSVRCLKIFLLALPLGGVPMMSSNFFQSVGKPMQASIISLSKQVFFMIPLVLILPRFMGVEGVLWAGCWSDVLSFGEQETAAKVCDIYRLADGKLAEHWDVLQMIKQDDPGASGNGHF